MTVFKIISTNGKRNEYRNTKSDNPKNIGTLGYWKIRMFKYIDIGLYGHANNGRYDTWIFYRNVCKNEQTINGLNSQFTNNINN